MSLSKESELRFYKNILNGVIHKIDVYKKKPVGRRVFLNQLAAYIKSQKYEMETMRNSLF